MAINPSIKYVGRITAPDANYTYGSGKDETAPGAGDGTPYELGRANDIFGFQQALLRSAGIVPSGNSETQLASEYTQAIVEIASGRGYNYDDSGVADAYVLDVQSGQHGPASLFDGQICEFVAGATNTAASTVNVNGLGVKNIVGTSAAGTITINERIRIRYRLGTTDFELITIPTVETILEAVKGADEDVTSSTTLQDDDDLKLTLEANTIYSFEAEIKFFNTGGAGDSKHFWSAADGTYGFQVLGTNQANTSITSNGMNEGTSAGLVLGIVANNKNYTHVKGIIETGGAGGVFKLQWAQNVSDVIKLTVQADSYVRAIKIQ